MCSSQANTWTMSSWKKNGWHYRNFRRKDRGIVHNGQDKSKLKHVPNLEEENALEIVVNLKRKAS